MAPWQKHHSADNHDSSGRSRITGSLTKQKSCFNISAPTNPCGLGEAARAVNMVWLGKHIFIDDMQFRLQNFDGRARVYRRRNKRYSADCVMMQVDRLEVRSIML